MTYMFSWCESLKTLDLSNFNTSKVVDMKEIMRGCYLLETLNFLNFTISSIANVYLIL